jgi:hypothetical protein
MFEARVDQLAYDFNCRPLGYVHESWIVDDLARRAVAGLRASPDAQARSLANRWLLARFGLDAAHDFDFTDGAKRLLLIDAQSLRELSLWLGLLGVIHVVRRWVDRERRNVLQQALGVAGHAFLLERVLRWSPVLRLSVSDGALRLRDAAQLQALACRLGAAQLLSACGTLDHPAVRRAQLKLPRTIAAMRLRAPMRPERAQSVTTFAVDCVVRHRMPAWHWLF